MQVIASLLSYLNNITIFIFVGMTGFEPATTRSQSDHSTRLNYIPITFQKSHLSGRASIWWLGSMSHPLFPFWNISLFRGLGGTRTPDSRIKSALLYQLSYKPILVFTSCSFLFLNWLFTGLPSFRAFHYRELVVVNPLSSSLLTYF